MSEEIRTLLTIFAFTFRFIFVGGNTDQLQKLIFGQYFLGSISISCTTVNTDPGYPIFIRFLSDF